MAQKVEDLEQNILTARGEVDFVQVSGAGLSVRFRRGSIDDHARHRSVAFTATSNAPWLTVSPQSGAAPISLTVSASVRGLGIGAYTGAISISPAGGSPLSIPVNLVITPPVTLLPNPSTLNFTYSQGGSGPVAQSVQIPSRAGGSVAFTTASGASWLTASPLSGSTPATLTVTVGGNLAAGTYSGTVSVTVGGNVAASIVVTATVSPLAAAGISANPSSLTFSNSVGSAAAPTQSIRLSASGGTAIPFTVVASSAGNWLSVSPSGSAPSTLVVSASPTGLSPGSYSGERSVSGEALYIPVTLTVTQPALPTITGVVNAASFAAGAVSPGELISIVGSNLGPATPAYLALDASGNVATSIGTTPAGAVIADLPMRGHNFSRLSTNYKTERQTCVNKRSKTMKRYFSTLSTSGH